MRLRRASWIVGVSAALLPGAFCYVQLRAFDAWASQQQGIVCATGLIGVMTLAGFAAALISLVAVVLGVLAYRRQAGPRTLRRNGEIVLIAGPLIVFMAMLLPSLPLARLF